MKMKKTLKKMTIITMCLSLILLVVSCDERDQESAYSRGYEIGFEEGEREGIRSAQKYFEKYANWELPMDISAEYDFHPIDALNVLMNYVDGEPITEEELYSAILAIREYYFEMKIAVEDIDNYTP